MLSLRKLVNENWWDNMSDAAKKSYIKKHGEAPNVAGDDEPKVPAPDSKSDKGKPRVSANPYDDNYGQEVDDEPKVPAPDSKSDKGKPRVSANPYDDNYGQEVDDEGDYDMGAVPGSRELDDTPEDVDDDDYDSEKGSSLTSAPGRVPDEDSSERLGQIAQERATLEQEMADAEEMGDKNAYADAQEKIDDLDKEEAELGGSGEEEPDKKDDLGKPYPKGNAPPKTSKIDRFSSQKWLDVGLEQQKEYERHLNRWAEEAADNDDDETLAKIQELMDDCKAEQERLETAGASDAFDPDNPKVGSPYDDPDDATNPGHYKRPTSGRTGNELNQETLMIDGKQYRRISESVKKESIPKYEFSEFYETFKNGSKKMKQHTLKENYEKIFGSIEEDWWDDMDASAQAQYIKDHPGSQQAQQADDAGGADDAIKKLKDKYPNTKLDDEEPSGEPVAEPKPEPEVKSKSPEEKEAESRQAIQDIKDADYAALKWRRHQAKGPYADWHMDRKGSDLNSDARSATNKIEKRRQAVISGEVEPTAEEAQAHVRDMEETIKNWFERPFKGTTPGWAPSREELEKMKEMLKEYKKKVKHMKKGFFGSKYETIMIDGKQYNRISEGVEKQPKPKYEFSEFYQRFKR